MTATRLAVDLSTATINRGRKDCRMPEPWVRRNLRIFTQDQIIDAAQGVVVPGLRNDHEVPRGPYAIPVSQTTWPCFLHARRDGYLIQRGLTDSEVLGHIWEAWCRVQRLPFVQITTFNFRPVMRLDLELRGMARILTPWGVEQLARTWRGASHTGSRWNVAPDHIWIDGLAAEGIRSLAAAWLQIASNERASRDRQAVEHEIDQSKRSNIDALTPGRLPASEI